MDAKLLSFLVGIIGTIGAVFLTGPYALVGIITSLLGFGVVVKSFLNNKEKPFTPEDPYDFYWRPIFVLGVVILLIIYFLGKVM